MSEEVSPIEKEVMIDGLKSLEQLALIEDHIQQSSRIPIISLLNLVHEFVLMRVHMLGGGVNLVIVHFNIHIVLLIFDLELVRAFTVGER